MPSFNEIVQTAARYKQENPEELTFYIAPDIPPKKLKNAADAYGAPNMGNVAALYDATIFGSAKDGILLTEAGVYYHYLSDNWSVAWESIVSLDFIGDRNGDASILIGTPDGGVVTGMSVDKTMLMHILSDLTGLQPAHGFDPDAYTAAKQQVPQSVAAGLDPDRIRQTAEKYKQQYGSGLFYVSPDIPPKKLKNAVQSYGRPDMGPVAALYDATILGSGKEGILLTGPGLFYQYMQEGFFAAWDRIASLDYTVSGTKRVMIVIGTADGEKLSLGAAINKPMLMHILSDLTGLQPLHGFDAGENDAPQPIPQAAPAPVPQPVSEPVPQNSVNCEEKVNYESDYV